MEDGCNGFEGVSCLPLKSWHRKTIRENTDKIRRDTELAKMWRTPWRGLINHRGGIAAIGEATFRYGYLAVSLLHIFFFFVTARKECLST